MYMFGEECSFRYFTCKPRDFLQNENFGSEKCDSPDSGFG